MNSINEKDLHVHLQILRRLRTAGATLLAVISCFLLEE